MSLFAELKRRNVIRPAVLYVGAVWALAQGITQLAPVVGMSDWVVRWFLVACVIGFPFWIALAWFYEFTPEGLRRESELDPAESITAHTGRKMDRWIFAVMGLAIVLLLTDRFVMHQGVNEEGAMPVQRQSIAVLPFTDLSQAKDQEYFSDGIAEELLNLLAKIPQLQVTARTSSFYFKGKDIKIPEIARQLHVAHILEGSVQKAGNQVRITVQLVDAGSDTQRWSQTWDRKLDDIFKIQDEIASEVVEELKVKLLGAAPKARTTNTQAYALYLQANEVQRQPTAEASAKAEALYREALAIDPSYAPAWDALARLFIGRTIFGTLSNQEGFARARAAVDKALSIDPDYAPAHLRLGWIAMYGDNDLASAAKHFERALALDPTNLDVLRNAATLLGNLGHLDEALALNEAIVRRDPVSVPTLFNTGLFQRYAGRYNAAIASYRTVLKLNPGMGIAHFQLGLLLLLKGDANGALAEIEQETSELWHVTGLAIAYYALGRKADSDTAIAALTAKYGKDGAYNVASVRAFRGEADEAFEWLEKGLEFNGAGPFAEIPIDNVFARIHSDPRWLPFLRKIGKAPEQLAKIQFHVTLPDN